MIENTVRAECTPAPDCISLGYTKTTCEGKFVRCPFDTSKLFCAPCDSIFQYYCNGNGEIGNGTSCNGKYKSCACNSGYSWSGSTCVVNCSSSSYNWCPVHSNCHGNCCTDGTLQPCDSQCGGSGCTSPQEDYYFWCCDRSRCDFDDCYSKVKKDCEHNDGYTDCTGSREFQFCVGPDFVPSINDDLTGQLGVFPHNGALYRCRH